MRGFLQDVVFAVRQLRHHRAYAMATIVSMALGIGAAAAVYSVLYGVLIDPYPYRDANRIAFITIHSEKDGDQGGRRLTLRQAEQLRSYKSVADVMAQGGNTSMIATDGDLPVSVHTEELTGNGFEFLGAPPMLGRFFTAAEAPVGIEPPPVAVISYLFWRTHFNSRNDVLGRQLELNHRKYTVIGVASPRFTWGDNDVYLPMPANLDPDTRFQTLIRLSAGVTTAQASADLTPFIEQDNRDHPKMFGPEKFRVEVQTLNDYLLGQFKGTLFLLFCAVGLLLLIGCGNVSILMLARGNTRQREIALRAALGASRLRVLRQLLTEAVVLSLAGAALGIGLAYLGIRLITGLLPEYSIPHEVVISINLPVLIFSASAAIVCGLVFGISPALQLSRPRSGQLMPSAGSRTATSRHTPLQAGLLAGQVALSMVLLAAGAAAMRNYLEATTATLGLNPHPVLQLNVQLPEGAYTTWQARVNYYDQMLEKIDSTGGVAAASIAAYDPLDEWQTDVSISGQSASSSTQQTGLQLVSAGYFSTLQIPLVSGRLLTRAEILRGAPVAVVSRTFVKRYFDGKDAIGGHFSLPVLASSWPNVLKPTDAGQPLEIVGIVEDVRNDGLHRPAKPQVFVPYSLFVPWGEEFLARATGNNPAALGHPVAASLVSLDRNQAVSRVMPLDDFISTFMWSRERFTSVLFALFAAVALALAMIGLFSVVAYGVEQRTREIGIRVALGARRWHVLTLALSTSLQATAAGLAVGILASILLSNTIYRWTDSSTRNPEVLSIVSLVFLLTALVACLWPANRALRVDPLEALRAE